MKEWIKKKRVQAGFIEHGFASCVACPAGVVLHGEYHPPMISCGDAQDGAGKTHLFSAQEMTSLCPRKLKKKRIALHEKVEQKKRRERLYRHSG